MRFVCGQCGRQFDADDPQPGGEVVCPGCHRRLPVPPTDQQLDGHGLIVGRPRTAAGFAAEARRALRRRIYVVCGNCRTSLAVPSRHVGKTRRCPSCGRNIRIPLPEGDQPARTPEEIDAAADSRRERDRIVESRPPDTRSVPAARSAPPAATGQPARAGAAVDGPSVGGGGPAAAQAAGAPKRARRLAPAASVAAALGLLLAAGALLYSRFAPTRAKPPRRGPPGGRQELVKASGPRGPARSRSAPVRPGRPRKVAARYEGVTATADLFAAGGYHVAAPGRAYWKVDARITAGTDPLSFKTAGPDVTLRLGQETIESLGVPGGGGLLPPRSTPRTARVEPGRTRRLAFLFDVPARLRSATLRVAGLGPTRLRANVRATAPGTEGLEGTYVEQPPRNLRPVLRDPVMAAVQSAPAGQLLVTRRGRALLVSMPRAAVAGPARRTGRGLYDVVLGHGKHTIKSKLRLFDSGRRLVLYLSDRPFHQLTFKRRRGPGGRRSR